MTDGTTHEEAREPETAPAEPTELAESTEEEVSTTIAVRERLIERIGSIDDISVLIKARLALDEALVGDARDEYDDMLTHILVGDGDDDPLEIGIDVPDTPAVVRFEKRVAPWVFAASCMAFVVIGLALMLLPDDRITLSSASKVGLASSALLLGLFFAAELGGYVWLMRRDKLDARPGYIRRRLLTLLMPPLRLGFHDVRTGDLIWIPWYGWSRINHQLFEKLRRRFSTPMILVALLIVPMLVIEWKLMAPMSAVFPGGEAALHTALQVGQALIWAAFAFEFFFMVSIAESKFDYCKRNWLDILIILLPLVSFFRSIRVLRALRLNQLARGYRLKGVIIKARQALVIADAVQRMLFPAEKHAASIAAKMKQNRRDRAELERQALVAIERIKAKGESEAGKTKKSPRRSWLRRRSTTPPG